MLNEVALSFIKANFRPATEEDFAWGLEYVIIRKVGGDKYTWYKNTIGARNLDITHELHDFLHEISRGEAWISLGGGYYSGIPIGFDD